MNEIVKNTGAWLKNPNIFRRLGALGAMILIVWVFRHLALLFIFFFLATRGLKWLSVKISPVFRGNQRLGLMTALALVLSILAACGWLLFRFGINYAHACVAPPTENGAFQYLRELRTELVAKLPACLPINTILDHLLSHLQEFVKLRGTFYANIVGRGLLYIVIGLIVAVVYLLDQKRVDTLLESAHPNRFFGILRDYFRFLGEAILITVKLQVIVALVNTILTLPVLLILQLPRLGVLIAVIFFSGLVPIMGNLISGAVLVAYSYLHKGISGVVIFLVITAVLHKIEAYFLNPRLASKHVQLPTLFLIFSLIAFEYLFGLVGIFLSFPCLYVGIKIAQDMKRALAASEIETNGG